MNVLKNKSIFLFWFIVFLFFGIAKSNAQKNINDCNNYLLTYSDFLDGCLWGYVLLNPDSIVFYQERLTRYGNDISGVWDTITLHTITKKDTLFKYIKMIQDLKNDTVFYNIDTNFICDGGIPPYITLYQKKDGSFSKIKEWFYRENTMFTSTFMEFSDIIWSTIRLYRKESCVHVKK